jgi:hypothetical protein
MIAVALIPVLLGQAPAPVLPAGGVLVPAETMASPRAAHTLTRLQDGRVLVAGGMTGSERSAAGSELFDPATGHFTSAGEMRIPRHSHTATLLPDGRVLLAGGYDAGGQVLAEAELYDPNDRRFVSAGTMGTARAGHVAVLLADGRVLLVGGVGEGWIFLASAELYDPGMGRFLPTGSMHTARESHVAVRLLDGRVLVVGGHSGRRGDLRILADAEAYDPTAGRFAPAGRSAVPRHKHDALLLDDGRVLVTGGADRRDSQGVYRSADLYDPATATFRLAGAMRLPRYKHQGTSVRLPDGRVLVAGGAARPEVYDPREDTFHLIRGEGNLPGLFSAAAPAGDGEVLITGGYAEDRGPAAAAWLFRATPASGP